MKGFRLSLTVCQSVFDKEAQVFILPSLPMKLHNISSVPSVQTWTKLGNVPLITFLTIIGLGLAHGYEFEMELAIRVMQLLEKNITKNVNSNSFSFINITKKLPTEMLYDFSKVEVLSISGWPNDLSTVIQGIVLPMLPTQRTISTSILEKHGQDKWRITLINGNLDLNIHSEPVPSVISLGNVQEAQDYLTKGETMITKYVVQILTTFCTY